MAKYRDTTSGAVVDVRDDKVMGLGWERVDDAPEPKTRRTRSKGDEPAEQDR